MYRLIALKENTSTCPRMPLPHLSSLSTYLSTTQLSRRLHQHSTSAGPSSGARLALGSTNVCFMAVVLNARSAAQCQSARH